MIGPGIYPRPRSGGPIEPFRNRARPFFNGYRMIIGIAIFVLAFTGFLTWIFWKDELEFAFIVAIFVLGLEIIVAVMSGPAYLLGSYTCSQVAEKMGVEYDYGFFTGCFVKDENGKWYNYDQQRIVK